MNRKILLFVALVIVAGLVLPSVISAKPSRAPRVKPACNDKIDNDGDGLVDMNDPGCSSRRDTSELNPNIECDDGIDNDGDGAVDYNDGGCSSPTDNDESNCGDGVCEGGETSGNCPADCGEPDSCSDTDGGIDYPTYGTVSGYYSSNPYSYDDLCNGTILTEFYCSGDQYDLTSYDCTSGAYNACVDGECVYLNECEDGVDNDGDGNTDYPNDAGCSSSSDDDESNCGDGVCEGGETQQNCPSDCGYPDSCSDTDGGIYFYVAGTVSGYDSNNPYSYDDLCNGTILTEFYCTGTDWELTSQDCSSLMNTTTCSEGRCI